MGKSEGIVETATKPINHGPGKSIVNLVPPCAAPTWPFTDMGAGPLTFNTARSSIPIRSGICISG